MLEDVRYEPVDFNSDSSQFSTPLHLLKNTWGTNHQLTVWCTTKYKHGRQLQEDSCQIYQFWQILTLLICYMWINCLNSKTKQPGASLLIMDADNMDVCMLQQLMEQKQTLSCILILQISIVQWWACDHIRAHQISGCARGHIQSVVKILAAISSSSQSTPVSKFSPVTALQLMIHQWWLLISSRASACRRRRHCHLPFMDKWIVIW